MVLTSSLLKILPLIKGILRRDFLPWQAYKGLFLNFFPSLAYSGTTFLEFKSR